MYVDPAVARRGVGTRLLRALESRARDRSLPGLGLHASKNAVGFYRARGYERLGTCRHEFGDSGVTGVVVEMAREL